MLAWPGRAPASGNMGVNCPVRPLVGFRRPAGLAQGELVAPGWVIDLPVPDLLSRRHRAE